MKRIIKERMKEWKKERNNESNRLLNPALIDLRVYRGFARSHDSSHVGWQEQ
jgi:hypothetical protein